MPGRIDVDLTGVDEFGSGGGVELLPPSDKEPYGFKVLDVGEGTSQTGNPKLILRLEVVEAPSEFGGQGLEGKAITRSFSLVKKELPLRRLKSLVTACGIPYDRQGFNPEDLQGTMFLADVVVEEWNGREFNGLENLGPYEPYAEENAGGGNGADEDPEESVSEPDETPALPGRQPRTARTAPSRRQPSRRRIRE